MWTFDDASRLGGSDMDNRRACPSYEAGLDVCDPLGSVLDWSGREPARILRRRCRSEGIDRSPYEDVSREANRSADGNCRYHRALPNKSHFTLNNSEPQYAAARFRHECSLPAAENGDYVMAHDQDRFHGYQPGRSKLYRKSPTRPLLVTTLSNTKVDDRLPKVEELLEKVDQDMMEVQATKQPLKSILNNPLPNSPLHGILKKPKNRSQPDSKCTLEGRRRQRAASESDNLFSSFNSIGSPIPGYDNRLSYLSTNTKRAKDNSGIGYSYGSAIASLGSGTTVKSPTRTSSGSKQTRVRKDQMVVKGDHDMHLLRTTAINETNVLVEPRMDMPRQDTPTPTCPAVSPALPVSSVTTIPVGKKAVKIKKKVKSAKTKGSKMKTGSNTDCCGLDLETEEALSRSPSPDPLMDHWQMDTDAALAELEIMEEPALPSTAKKEEENLTLVTKLSSKLNGTVVTPKKAHSKDKVSKEQMFLTALHTTNPFKSMPARKESPTLLPESVANCLRPSLFPRVPPYLKFIGHEESPCLKVPLPIQKHLKWKLTTITPIVVKKTLTNSGFRLVKSECDTAECPQEDDIITETIEWIGIWGKHMKSIMFRAIKDGQKMNHFPGTFQIGRKDRLWRNLQKLVCKYGISEFGIMPKTYVLPHDMKLLKHDWEKYAANNEKWIIKPPASARGTGIKVVSKWTQIPKKRPVVVQRYVSKPYLINGNKFDLRLYVLVTSVHPLRIYLYKDGLARFASVKYNDELSSLNDRYMHLTNYSINRLSKNYTPNEDFAACEGHKWTLQTLLQYLKSEKRVDTDSLWNAMKDLVIKTIISGEASISSLTKANITSRYNCYELFGIDVLLDEDLKPWLLEVNISPSLHSASPLDIHVKGPLVTTVLNIAQFQVPVKTNLEMLSKDKPHKLFQVPGHTNMDTVPKQNPKKLSGLPYDSRLYTVYLSKEERDKHIIYTNMEDRDMYLRDILSTLTPDDVRHLIQSEDELTQSGDMERIFPTPETHKYLGFLAGPRYYNRLFDAWETRYGRNREPGLELLRNLCDIGYHLEVPPVPLKNDVDAPSPAPSERPSVPSLTSLEHGGGGGGAADGAGAGVGRACGPLAGLGPLGPLALPALEPRA
ncbi:tubulin polyglutamylase ttll-4 isoform X6 [Spodoptera frugiperda]|uniref:Tubulin polyglutamylase ttll-4 isoform X6 n=1 Tax=Spodoptera frugiperda TaxID=7108 RepID=A0A9R0DGX9_SPOFR|nr:tubulin polyglutamylase ttll-4 isoform X6 [Spodoptera frugiperda]